MSLLEQLGIPWILSGLLLIPYLCWGVYLLKVRFQHQTELSVAGEAVTFLGLVVFFVVQFAVLSMWLSKSPVLFLLAVLGLLASLLALYGPMLMSLGSHVLVDAVMPSGAPLSHTPKYGAEEGFEQKGDYEAAAREYMAVARMFPKESRASLRAGDNLMKLDRPEEAVVWLKRGLHCLAEPEESLRVVNRIAEIYYRRLNRPEDAKEAFRGYLERFPDAEYADSVKRRLARLGGRAPFEDEGPASPLAGDPPALLPEGPSYISED
ncbi:MAG TPA: tetratricopeptide repeat protein [Candidatus Hydrogenedentes bacterium]|nr:tetratricopeptide repeat protein [Candidatus Hydrogenedentota bacterium]